MSLKAPVYVNNILVLYYFSLIEFILSYDLIEMFYIMPFIWKCICLLCISFNIKLFWAAIVVWKMIGSNDCQVHLLYYLSINLKLDKKLYIK